MSTPFQNRLVGTVIIAAIAIIFLPDILDGEKKTYQEEFEQIPAAPTIDFQPSDKQLDQDKFAQMSEDKLSDEQALDDAAANSTSNTVNTNTEDSTVVKVTSLPKVEKVIKEAKSTPKTVKKVDKKLPEKAVLREAWVIQLGSFRHKKNVDELLKKLKDNGYTAFSKPIKTRSGNLTKVFVGPELIRTSLEKKIPALKKLTAVEGKVARFKPTK